jgi:Ca2+-binding RTX toxin-like protein
MSSPIIDIRFQQAMFLQPSNAGWLVAYWQMLPEIPLASMTIQFGDGRTDVFLPFGTDPLTSGSIYNTYALPDGILDTFAIQLTGTIAGGGTVMQQVRFIVDAANNAGRNFAGTGYSDAVLGGEGNDTVSGLNGHDLIYGGNGLDLLSGGPGDDTLDGGAGDDTLHGGNGQNAMFGGDGSDAMVGGADADYMVGDNVGGGWDDTLSGGGGNDDLIAYGGNDRLLGGLGDDYLDGGEGDDRMIGGDGDDALFGWHGNDYARGDAGDDHLSGDDGNDRLLGGEGADTLIGGRGADMLRLGASDGAADVVVLASNEGVDRIYEFEAGRDRILLLGIEDIAPARFVAGSAPRAPLGAEPALLYNNVSGRLYIDHDGRGGNAAELLAIFDGQPSLTHADFLFD